MRMDPRGMPVGAAKPLNPNHIYKQEGGGLGSSALSDYGPI